MKSFSPHPRRLWITIPNDSYRNQPADDACLPQWVSDNDWMSKADGVARKVLRTWGTEPVDAYITLLHALAAGLDGEPFFEAITLNRETAVRGWDQPGFTQSAHNAGLLRLADEANRLFVQTNVSLAVNLAGSQAEVNGLIDGLRSLAPKVGVSGPDTVPTYVNDDVAQGLAYPQDLSAYNTIMGNEIGGGVSSASVKQPIMWRVETSELGGGTAGSGSGTVPSGYVAQEAFDVANDHLKASHFA
ncbi:MAG: hypothetical protein JRI23_33380 [Deltaproteobacteria bacterium]|nr:hypothetical protein [Deltaproteobacteria bacterium]MBW2537172.1 hypothetical protein [Deltaproteobacteria bacterium]